jgi:peptide deformylase
MTQLTILRYPDPRLHTVARPVPAVDARIRTLVADMLETMYAAEGIGLAASQVNVHERVVVIDVSEGRDQPLVLVNPEIVWSSPETQVNDEGCLSVPGIYDGVERASAIKVQALDLDGQQQTHSAEGLLSSTCRRSSATASRPRCSSRKRTTPRPQLRALRVGEAGSTVRAAHFRPGRTAPIVGRRC